MHPDTLLVGKGQLQEYRAVYNQGVSCVDDTVDSYFLQGTVPSADPMC